MDWIQLWQIASAPDNVPIIIMLVLVGFYTVYSMKQALANDRLAAELEADPAMQKNHHRKTQPFQKGWAERVHVWPYLLKIEFLAAIIVMLILMVWSIALDAPLEEPANPSLTMNPSKAPWYFLGLQEMLVYFDPWIAGVVLPGIIVVGLMAIPYIDVNPLGNGYYTFKERWFSITVFLYGFIVLWVLLIILGTFLRGPNWNFFGPFQYWDPHIVESLSNVNLSQYFWNWMLEKPLPTNILLRELPGFIVVILYFALLPPLMANFGFRRMYTQLGFIRFNTMAFLFITMMALPVKMILRWTVNLKYIVAIPEWFFNI